MSTASHVSWIQPEEICKYHRGAIRVLRSARPSADLAVSNSGLRARRIHGCAAAAGLGGGAGAVSCADLLRDSASGVRNVGRFGPQVGSSPCRNLGGEAMG